MWDGRLRATPTQRRTFVTLQSNCYQLQRKYLHLQCQVSSDKTWTRGFQNRMKEGSRRPMGGDEWRSNGIKNKKTDVCRRRQKNHLVRDKSWSTMSDNTHTFCSPFWLQAHHVFIHTRSNVIYHINSATLFIDLWLKCICITFKRWLCIDSFTATEHSGSAGVKQGCQSVTILHNNHHMRPFWMLQDICIKINTIA